MSTAATITCRAFRPRLRRLAGCTPRALPVLTSAVFAAAVAPYVTAADRVSTFRNGNANWNNASAWNPVGVPNNGALTYDAVFSGHYSTNGVDTLGLNIEVTIQRFTLSDGFLLGSSPSTPHTLMLNDTFTWTSGIIGNAAVVASAGGSIAATKTCILEATTLQNGGNLTYSATFASTGDGQLPLRLDAGGVIANRAGATFDMAGDAGISVTSGTARIYNDGLWVKSAGTGVATVRAGFSDTGTLRVLSGTLELVGGISQHSGTVDASSGATLYLHDGSQTFTPTATLGGQGTLQFASDDVEFNGKLFGGAGPLQVLQGHTHFNAGADITSLGLAPAAGGRALRLIRQGTTNFDTGHAVPIADLSTDSSASPSNTSIVLTGGDDLVLTGPANWTGGTVSGPTAGPVNTLEVDAALTIGGFGMALDHRRLLNHSTVTWNAGYIQAKQGAVIENAADGTFDIRTDTRLEWGPTRVGAPLPVLQNAGLIVKSAGAGITEIDDVRLTNTGTLRVASGTLLLFHSGGGPSPGAADTGVNSGVYEILAGATLNVSDHTMDADSTVRGAGTMQFRGNANAVLGAYQVTGRTAVDSGGLAFKAGANVTDVGQTLELGFSGGVTFDIGRPITLRDVIVNGSLGGSDPIEITGTLSGAGTLSAPHLVASGVVAPGNSPGTLNVAGGLRFTPTTRLAIELARTDADAVIAAGGLTVDGLLTLQLLDGYVPTASDRWTILTAGQPLAGTFDDVAPGARLATLDGVGSFVINYGPTSPFGSGKVVLSNFKLAPAPEPTGLWAIPAVAALLVRRRRRPS